MSLLRIASRVASLSNKCAIITSQKANVHRWVRPTLLEIRARRKRLLLKNGPQKPPRRSEFIDWNYEAEIYAFGVRLHEQFNFNILQQAFVDRSYIVQEEMKQRAVGIENPVIELSDNSKLVQKGEELITEFVISFLNISLPKYPREGIKAIYQHLTSDDCLARISRYLGTKDLILSAEYPPTKDVFVSTFKAVVGALFESSGEARAYEFIRDFVCTQLNQRDVNEYWKIQNPVELLKEICIHKKLDEPEPRLISQMGKNTLLAVNYVGIYSNKKMLGAGFGEDMKTAVKEAAKDCLRNFFETNTSMKPLDFKMPVEKVMSTLNKPAIAAASIDKL